MDCVPKRVLDAERLRGTDRLQLCPLLGVLALDAQHRTPAIERHFVRMANGCASGEVPLVQRLTGQPLVDAVVAIRKHAEAEGVLPSQNTAEAA